MNFEFMVAKPAGTGFSLFLQWFFYIFLSVFQHKTLGSSVFSAFWSMNSKFMVNDFGVCYNINKEAN